MAKETNPKNAALEADILKAAEGAVDQKAVKDKATEIAGKAPEAETVQGKTETMQGTPGPGVQLPGSDLPAGTQTTGQTGTPATQLDSIVPADYNEYLQWKAMKEAQANTQPSGQPAPVISEYEAKRQAAEEAARKAYNAIMDSQGQANATLDQSKNTDAASLHEQRLRMYGPGYVVAKRQGVEQVFTQQTWKLLGGRSNKDGYVEVVATPPEVANMKKAQ